LHTKNKKTTRMNKCRYNSNIEQENSEKILLSS
jgi:hypothetical protein